MEFDIDRRIYSDEVISKTIYWFSKDFIITRMMKNDFIETVRLEQKDLLPSLEDIKEKFFLSLNDFKLREIIGRETKDIKTILYARAFAEDDTLIEDDITD